jgi:hypothetical protein
LSNFDEDFAPLINNDKDNENEDEYEYEYEDLEKFTK